MAKKKSASASAKRTTTAKKSAKKATKRATRPRARQDFQEDFPEMTSHEQPTPVYGGSATEAAEQPEKSRNVLLAAALGVLAVVVVLIFAKGNFFKKKEQAEEGAPTTESTIQSADASAAQAKPETAAKPQTAQDTKKPVPATGGQGEVYTVAAGDSLNAIAAKKLGTEARAEEIRKMNPKVNFDALQIGQKIQLPAR